MKVTRFDPRDELIVVDATVWGPLGGASLRMVVDTGASMTLVEPHILDELGYSPRDGERMTVIRSAVAEEPGYTIRVARFGALGFQETSFLLHAHQLPDGYGIQGLIGLDYLRHFRIELDIEAGRISVGRRLA